MSLKKLALIICLAMPLLAGGAEPFRLTSPDFPANGQMPEQFVYNAEGCTGGNVSPELRWSGAPAGTRSFVVTLFDADEHATPSGWWHWILFDIPGSSTGLARGAGMPHASTLPKGAVHGRGDDGTESYSGPCPEPRDPAHRYVFTVYALKVDKLPVAPGSSGAMVSYAVHEFTLAKATLIARHRNRAAH